MRQSPVRQHKPIQKDLLSSLSAPKKVFCFFRYTLPFIRLFPLSRSCRFQLLHLLFQRYNMTLQGFNRFIKFLCCRRRNRQLFLPYQNIGSYKVPLYPFAMPAGAVHTAACTYFFLQLLPLLPRLFYRLLPAA